MRREPTLTSHSANERRYRRFDYQGTVPAHLRRIEAWERNAFIQKVEDVCAAGPAKLADHEFVRLLDNFMDGDAERRIAAIVEGQVIGLAVCFKGHLRLAAAPNIRDLMRKTSQERCYIPNCFGEWKCQWLSPDGLLDWRMYVDRDGTIKIVRQLDPNGLVRYATVNPSCVLLGPLVRFVGVREA
jgi:hypothetical protein